MRHPGGVSEGKRGGTGRNKGDKTATKKSGGIGAGRGGLSSLKGLRNMEVKTKEVTVKIEGAGRPTKQREITEYQGYIKKGERNRTQ